MYTPTAEDDATIAAASVGMNMAMAASSSSSNTITTSTSTLRGVFRRLVVCAKKEGASPLLNIRGGS